ncbi:hypothetical protein Cgig2_008423 [Carnegiea gigantea]|uniref:Uncharacterized protein n=1 Tax=Carnegiea gigantea TaxID=171969 RepID=A0A9Q1GMM0_9CARY|nr:hypothetical protein Cgig2_008423 [Carnegiea gigantea]
MPNTYQGLATHGASILELREMIIGVATINARNNNVTRPMMCKATYNEVIPIQMRGSNPNPNGPYLIHFFTTLKRGPIAKERKRGPKELRTYKKFGGLHHNSTTCEGQGNRPSKIVGKMKPPFDSNGEGQGPIERPRKQHNSASMCSCPPTLRHLANLSHPTTTSEAYQCMSFEVQCVI